MKITGRTGVVFDKPGDETPEGRVSSHWIHAVDKHGGRISTQSVTALLMLEILLELRAMSSQSSNKVEGEI